jgi:hypothetical protein
VTHRCRSTILIGFYLNDEQIRHKKATEGNDLLMEPFVLDASGEGLHDLQGSVV